MTALSAFVRRLLLPCVLAMLAALAMPGAARAASCGPATSAGTAPSDFRDYCWLDFTGYDDRTASKGSGQTFAFTLPDGTKVSMTLKASGDPLTEVASPSWSGAAFGNTAFMGIPGKPILYTVNNTSNASVTISNITVTPPSGGTSKYSIVVADGESTNGGESLTFTTNGDPWQQLAAIPNGNSSLYPTLSGVGTGTVKETGVAGTVGSYVFRSDNNPTQITANLVAGGLQGIIIGMRYASISVVAQIANQRYNAADQFTYGLATQTGTTLATASSSGTALSGFPVASVPTVAASYPFVINEVMAGGSVGTLSNYTVTLTCTNANAGSSTQMPTNQAVTSYTFQSLQYGDAVLCTFTNTPILYTITGSVYSDANHNGAQDQGVEGGLGISGVYVKVVPTSGGACSGPATQVVAPDATTGTYTITNLAQGTYCVVLDTNNTLSDITPGVPAGWLATQNASGLVQATITATVPIPPPSNFGLFNGSRLAGTVFGDTGVGSGTPNNGAKDGTEAGLGNVIVTASTGSTAVATATTAGDGTFSLWVPASVSGTVSVVPTLPPGYVATGGSAGTTVTGASGNYVRPNVTYSPATGQSYSGVTFGAAVPATFVPNGAETGQPGSVVFYAHTFTAGTGGSVSFALAQSANPASPAWSAVLYRDTTCSAAMDAADTVVSGAITVTAGQQVCLVVKQFIPASASYGSTNSTSVTASFSYTNANPPLSATFVVSDVTTVGAPSALALKKLVSNVTRGGTTSTSVTATPGEVLQYTLTAQNNGSSALTTLVINDTTPAFTTFVSAACPGTLPSGITACTVSSQPGAGAAGSLQWTFTGALGAGTQLAVSYQVRLSQ